MVSLYRTDLVVPGRGIDFAFTRRYNSKRSSQSGAMGPGWEHDFAVRLTKNFTYPPGSTGTFLVTIQRGAGRGDTFEWQASSSSWKSPTGVFSVLFDLHTGSTLTGWELRDPQGNVEAFDAFGRLTSIRDANANTLTIAYSTSTGTEIATVTDTLGRVMTFTHTSGLLTSMADHTGRTVTFDYDSTTHELLSATSPTVDTGTWNDFPYGKIEQYVYTPQSGTGSTAPFHLLTAVYSPEDVAQSRDPAEQFLYTKDQNGGSSYPWYCTRHVLADDTISMYYTSNQSSGFNLHASYSVTVVTDRKGLATRYHFSGDGRAEYIDEYDGSIYFTTSYVTDTEGRLAEIVYPENNKRQIAYDDASPFRWAQGNPLTVTLVDKNWSSHEIDTHYAWDPVFQQILSLTDGLGNTTTFAYDYMEGSDSSSDSNYNLDDIAAELRTNATFLATHDSTLHFSTLLRDEDVNGDGQHGDQIRGNLILRRLPDATLSQLGVSSSVAPAGQAGREGGVNQEAFFTYTYNTFGQLTSETDAEENVTVCLYHPESDPDGDGQNVNTSRDTSTGGFLATVIEDTDFALLSGVGARSGFGLDIGRDSGLAPTLTEKETSFEYDDVGFLSGVTDARGVHTSFDVNEMGETWRITVADDVSAATTRHGGLAGASESLTAFGYEQKFKFDANGNVFLVTYENADMDAEDDDEGDVHHAWETNFIHDRLNRVIGCFREGGASLSGLPPYWTYLYDANGNLSDVAEPEGNVVHFEHGARNLLLEVAHGYGEADGVARSFTYTDNGKLWTEVTGANLRQRVFEYDEFDRLYRVIDPVGSEAIVAYDDASNVIEILRRGLSAWPSGGTFPFTPSTTPNVDLAKAQFQYDERRRLVRRDLVAPTGTDGALTPGDDKVSARFDWDRLGRPTFSVEDDGKATETHFDGASRPTKEIDALGNSVAFGYDDNDNLIETTEVELYPSGGSVSSRTFETFDIYDALDRRTSTTDNAGQTHRFAYDSRGNVRSTTDAQGPMTPSLTINGRAANQPGVERRFWHDGLNRVWKEEYDVTPSASNSDGIVQILQAWDLNGRLVSKTDDNSNATLWGYDPLNRVTSETYADSTAKLFKYDGVGDLESVTDARGNVATLARDRAGRLTGVSFSLALGTSNPYLIERSTELAFEWDGLDRQITSFDNNDPSTSTDDWTVARVYDSLSRVVSENQGGQTVSSDWVEEGKRVALHYPTSSSTIDVTYTHDALDRISQIFTGGSTLLATYKHAGPYRVLSRTISFNGTKKLAELRHDGSGDDSNFWDAARRPIGMKTFNRVGTLLSGFEHEFDRADNRTFERRLHHSSSGDRYTHDELSRLVLFERGLSSPGGTGGTPQASTAWDLDGVHNWAELEFGPGTPVTQTNAVNALNEYTAFGSESPEHDLDGNLGTPDTAGDVVLYYDGLNRLRRLEDTSASTSVEHGYDAGGRRVMTATSGLSNAPSLTVFLHDGWDVIEERDGTTSTSNLLRRFVLGAEIDEPLRMENVSFYPNSGTYFYQRSTLGNIVALTDWSGAVVERYTYDAYGMPRFEDASNAVVTAGSPPVPISESAFGNPYLFNARRFEAPVLPLYEYRHRLYFGTVGRFVQQDPLGAWGDPLSRGNHFVALASSPENELDAAGLGVYVINRPIDGSGLPFTHASLVITKGTNLPGEDPSTETSFSGQPTNKPGGNTLVVDVNRQGENGRNRDGSKRPGVEIETIAPPATHTQEQWDLLAYQEAARMARELGARIYGHVNVPSSSPSQPVPQPSSPSAGFPVATPGPSDVPLISYPRTATAPYGHFLPSSMDCQAFIDKWRKSVLLRLAHKQWKPLPPGGLKK